MRFISNLKPPKKWQTWVIILSGSVIGLGLFILQESKAISYLSDDPKTCINCHVMTPEYITWDHSSHGKVTNCNDCHVPHDNVFRKYAFKAKDGLYHATIFTLHAEPEVIVMHEAGQEVVKANCIRCHSDQVTDAKASAWIEGHDASRTDRQCWECHREVPHGRVKSLSSVGYQVEPLSEEENKESIVPQWMKEQIDQNNTKK
ncbi:cytochrome c nitrite reductase small subunit [bacterium SCSIO 12643]|nr:cytochrome c nitrite reductase small subunit [bacterium SCSIO 12643]